MTVGRPHLFLQIKKCFKLSCNFYARQHCVVAHICHVNSVCPSVLRNFAHVCIKTAERIIETLSLSDMSVILVFVTKGCCIYLMASPITGVPKIKGGGSDFQPTCGYILETVIDRTIFTIEHSCLCVI